MKKITVLFLTALLTLCCIGCGSSSNTGLSGEPSNGSQTAITGSDGDIVSSSPRLDDGADLLSGDDEKRLTASLDKVSAKYGCDVVVVTVDSVGDKTVVEYADDYYDNHDFSSDGILLLINMEGRDWHISTAGFGITAFTDAGIQYIGEKIGDYLSKSSYYRAFLYYSKLCDTFLNQAKSGSPYDTGNMPQ